MFEKLKGHVPENVLTELQFIVDVNSPLRLAHFLAQCAHESGNFTQVHENLNYSTEGLLRVFPKYFSPQKAFVYAHRQEAIANKVYANRMGNADEGSGDGFKFRGRGYIQLTGCRNYSFLSSYLGKDFLNAPDLVATMYPLRSAAWFFTTNGLWKYCDSDDITTLTRKINNGLNGLPDRLKRLAFYKGLLA